jgi:hypothetical protein
MSDELYRPQKKPVTPAEVQSSEAPVSHPPTPDRVAKTPQENQSDLEQMAQMREQISKDAGNPNQIRSQEGGVQISGNIPPQLQEAVGRQKGPQSRPTPTDPLPPMRVTGSAKLEELIQGIQTDSLYESVQLPSKGIFYDGTDGPIDGIVNIRPMTGEEEQILATPRFVKKGQAINMIFNRCMREKDYNSEQFLSQDRTYLLIYLRGISYTPEYDVEVRDPETDQTFATIIDLNSLYVDYCPPDFGKESLQDVLPNTGYSFSYRLARGRDEQDVTNYRDQRVKNFDTAGQADDTLLYRTALLVKDIEGLTDKREIRSLLAKLPINDVAYLRTVVNEPPFGVDTKVSVASPYTMQEFEVELPLEANFFFPRAKRAPRNTQ